MFTIARCRHSAPTIRPLAAVRSRWHLLPLAPQLDLAAESRRTPRLIWFEQIFLFDVETENGGNDMSKQHPVFVEDKQKAPIQPKSETLQQSPAQEG
jgi:hypothetical protein